MFFAFILKPRPRAMRGVNVDAIKWELTVKKKKLVKLFQKSLQT